MKSDITDEGIENLLLLGHSRRYIRDNFKVGSARITRVATELHNRGFVDEGIERAPHIAPRGFREKRRAILYNHKSGQNHLEWITQERDADAQWLMLREVIDAMAEEIPREAPRALDKPNLDTDLVDTYICTDHHFGALSWAPETGEDYDIRIAEDLLVNWFSEAIALAPEAETGIFAQLGDLLHIDGSGPLLPVTPTNYHVVDSDSRFQKIVRVVIRVIRRIVNMLLNKHQYVHILMCEGNHDTSSSVFLREWLHTLYENEPRISVDCSIDPYYAYEHGNTALFFHHSHKTKLNQLDQVFASKFREIFGRTKYAYGHTGHLHHAQMRETNLMILEQHETLAAKDSHASRLGLSARRSASVITYSKVYGEVSRLSMTPEMVSKGDNDGK